MAHIWNIRLQDNCNSTLFFYVACQINFLISKKSLTIWFINGSSLDWYAIPLTWNMAWRFNEIVVPVSQLVITGYSHEDIIKSINIWFWNSDLILNYTRNRKHKTLERKDQRTLIHSYNLPFIFFGSFRTEHRWYNISITLTRNSWPSKKLTWNCWLEYIAPLMVEIHNKILLM